MLTASSSSTPVHIRRSVFGTCLSHVCAGKILTDAQTVAEYGIKETDFIVAMPGKVRAYHCIPMTCIFDELIALIQPRAVPAPTPVVAPTPVQVSFA